jgi:predicted lipoprotein with Yx(FWY)xxD motif
LSGKGNIVKLSRSRTAVLTVAGCAAFLFTAACGSMGTGSAESNSGGSAGAEAQGAAGGGGDGGGSSNSGTSNPVKAGPPGARATLNSLTSRQLGAIVTDAKGNTLYRFDRDSANPPKTRCVGPCAQTWPPVLATGDITVTGVDRGAVGMVKRPDGTMQLTLAGWPLYRYAQDKPGEVNGENVGKVWFASSPAGKKVIPPPGVKVGGNPNDGNYGGYGG